MPIVTPLGEAAPITTTQETAQPSTQLKTDSSQSLIPEVKPQIAPETEQKSTKEAEASESQRVKSLIHQQRQILRKKQELDLREKSLNEREGTYKPWQEASELAKIDKLKAIERLGVNYNDLTQQLLNNGQVPPDVIAAHKAEEIANRQIEAFKTEWKREQEETQKKQYQQALTNLNTRVESAVAKSDKFPLVKEAECYQDVTRFIESEFHRTGEVIPVEEALERWEGEILEGLSILANNERIRSRLFKEDKPLTEAPKIALEPQQKVTTLTHKTTTQATAAPAQTDAERRQRAIDAFHRRLA